MSIISQITHPLTVISRRLELEWHLECQILLGDGFDINVLDGGRLSSDSSQLDTVDQWLFQCDLLDTRVVETVHVVPIYCQRCRL